MLQGQLRMEPTVRIEQGMPIHWPNSISFCGDVNWNSPELRPIFQNWELLSLTVSLTPLTVSLTHLLAVLLTLSLAVE